jgi:hypothetical protein
MAYIRPNLKGLIPEPVLRAFKDIHDRLDVLDKFQTDTKAAGYVTLNQANAAFGPEATRSALKATGSAPINLHALQGIPAQLWNLPSYANNAAALAAHLDIGQYYRNGDVVQVVHD